MYFTRRKLPATAAQELRKIAITDMHPHVIMLAPVYVFMKRNEKFISVKAPLDFFTPAELERLLPYESFFLPEAIELSRSFIEAANHVKALLTWKPGVNGSKAPLPPVALPPTPYELSDGILRVIGPLWGSGPVIEPFFTAVFSDALCGSLPPELLERAREKDVDAYECAMLRSGLAVFLALHLGHCNLDGIRRLRHRVFEQNVDGIAFESRPGDVDEIASIVEIAFDDQLSNSLDGSLFEGRPERVAQKIASRLKRVTREFALKGTAGPSIYGPSGFIDAEGVVDV